MSGYPEHFAKHVRLVILRLLAEATEYRLNASILGDMVAAHGLAATRAQIRTEIAWLEEQGLLKADELANGLVVATLSERGLDVAAGRASVPGVQRPGPGL
jgi:Fe2+ or Zn2+ uptake regulation protein